MDLRRYRTVQYLLPFVVAACAATLHAEESTSAQKAKAENESAKYLRVRRDKDQEPVALETSITRYVKKRGADSQVIVDLVGAVHVGESGYYEELNKVFKSYDAVLYELVAPEGTRVVPGKRNRGNPVSFLQNMMKDVLKPRIKDRILVEAVEI